MESSVRIEPIAQDPRAQAAQIPAGSADGVRGDRSRCPAGAVRSRSASSSRACSRCATTPGAVTKELLQQCADLLEGRSLLLRGDLARRTPVPLLPGGDVPSEGPGSVHDPSGSGSVGQHHRTGRTDPRPPACASCATPTTWPESALPTRPPPLTSTAALQLHRCAPLPHSLADQTVLAAANSRNHEVIAGIRTHAPSNHTATTSDLRIAAAQVNDPDPARTRRHEQQETPGQRPDLGFKKSRLRDSNPRPTHYECGGQARAIGRLHEH